MRRLALLLTALLFAGIGWAQSVRLTADAPHAVIAGEKFQLVYTVNAEGSDFRVPPMDNFQVLMGPSTSQSTSMTIINGNVEKSSQFSYTYILKATQPGKYNIGAASIVVNGKKIESNSIQIEVIKGDDASAAKQAAESGEQASGVSSEDLFIVTSVSKRDVYKDEPLVLTTKIYVHQVDLQGLSDAKNMELKDFLSQELTRPEKMDWNIEAVNGKTYNVGIYEQRLLFPQKSGTLEIPSMELEFIIKQRVARRSQSVFDDFFESNYRTVKKRVSSKPLTVNVKPLPSGTPADFSGVVGDIKMDYSLSKNDIKTNDGVTLKIEVSGSGNHKIMSNPKINLPADFDQFEPKVTNNITNTAAGMAGSKVFEYLIIPRHTGDYVIPPVTLSYFDINSKQYKQLSTGEIKMHVTKGSGNESSSTATGPQYSNSREDLKFVGQDIRYIKAENENNPKPKGAFLLGSLMFYVMILLPLLLFIAFVMYAQKQMRENNDLVLSRNKKANKMALKRLQHSSVLLKKNDKEAFYEEVLRAVWGYLSDKLSLPVAKLSRENASTLLSESNVNEETISQIVGIIDTCEFARYSPSAGNSEMDKLYHQAIETITSLEEQIKKKA
jgi:hypothetical protein